ncbi:hypothetical protein [Scopulibacillus cellulosilyticus]|uniref:Uncharacterized protein n=1 Tax=Scopulibacillus cellulosilyticus TaxID=2665665 RepID=A0ABW2PZI2_9BACL
MIPLNINGDIRHFTDRSIYKLKSVLPYWGLSLNDQYQVAPLFSDKMIRINVDSPSLFHSIEEYVQHTGLSLINKKDQPLDFDIQYHSDGQHEFSIAAENKTYHFKPLTDHPTSVSRLIFKQIWLPVKVKNTTIILGNNNMQRPAEWIAYILLQYAHSQPLSPISHISMSDYQEFVKDVLYQINKKFAECQMLKEFWPSVPSEPDIVENQFQNTIADQEKEGIAEEKPIIHEEEILESHPFQPFKPKLNEHDIDDPEPINPFVKKKSRETHQINPFKKKHP